MTALATLGVAASSATAVNLPPGGAVGLPGTFTSGGTIIRDQDIPFEVLASDGTLLFGGVVQDRVVERADGLLIFSKRIKETVVDTEVGVVNVWVTDYTDRTTDVDWDPSSPGQKFPPAATRSGDGSLINYDFANNPIFESEESKFFYAETDAEEFTINGSMTIVVETGESTTITVASPAVDDTPPIGEIQSPDPLQCVCGQVQVEGVAYDPDGTYESDRLEYRAVTDTEWTLIGEAFSPVPPPGGPLYTWNTDGLSQGFYLLRLTVFNTAGLSSAVVTVVFVDQQFDNFQYSSPGNGAVVGGNVCPGGTLNDQCAVNFTIEYAPTGGGPFLPIDPDNPTYTGSRINQTFAVWDTTDGIADGEYILRVTASDDCDHEESETKTITVDNTAPTVEITAPMPCSGIDGLVEIVGTAFDENLAGWVVQYTGGGNSGWTTIASGNTNVVDDVLAVWDTSGLAACCYTIRVVATDTAVLNCNGAINHRSEYLVSLEIGGCTGDLNGDNVVDVNDLLLLLGGWGACP
jgi:hypothetical protein